MRNIIFIMWEKKEDAFNLPFWQQMTLLRLTTLRVSTSCWRRSRCLPDDVVGIAGLQPMFAACGSEIVDRSQNLASATCALATTKLLHTSILSFTFCEQYIQNWFYNSFVCVRVQNFGVCLKLPTFVNNDIWHIKMNCFWHSFRLFEQNKN